MRVSGQPSSLFGGRASDLMPARFLPQHRVPGTSHIQVVVTDMPGCRFCELKEAAGLVYLTALAYDVLDQCSCRRANGRSICFSTGLELAGQAQSKGLGSGIGLDLCCQPTYGWWRHGNALKGDRIPVAVKRVTAWSHNLKQSKVLYSQFLDNWTVVCLPEISHPIQQIAGLSPNQI